MLSRNELDHILKTAKEAGAHGISAALATVVSVHGSTYRRPGARMLIREDGVVAGGVSGGCLEADVIRKARFSLIEKKPRIHVYDTTDSDDAGFGASLNCRGEITILIEPIVTDRARAHLKLLREAQRAEHPTVIVLDITRTGNVAATAGIILIAPPDVHSAQEREELSSIAAEVIARQRYKRVQLEDGRELLFDYLPPALKIVLFGAGPESLPFSALARTLGCAVTVVDERPGYLRRYSFPAGVRTTTTSTENLSASVNLDATDACIIATHNAAYDRRVLQQVLASACPYLGLLGPRKRYLEFIAEFREARALRARDVERIYSPAGLDLGAETPEQIGLSILSEIHAVSARRTGGFLRHRSQALHDSPESAEIEAANA